MTKCERCDKHWVPRKGLCAPCQTQVDAGQRTRAEGHRLVPIEPKVRFRVPEIEPAPPRTVTIGGAEYEVIWPREWVLR
jgi:hypothetical protein